MFNKSQWNTYLQGKYRINKRHANGVIIDAKGQVESANQCRSQQVKQLKSRLKSIQSWIKKAERKLKIAHKFYTKKNKKGELTWASSKTGCNFPLSCSLRHRDTNWQHLRFQIHHKKRKAYHTLKKIEHLKVAPVGVKVPHRQCFVVGSKGETLGNQVCQWDGEMIKFRVPACE
ncbi:MAG: hypothetical protein F6K10_03490 [Moorea sp. SIO2B7]|nr:hypothetical protein [Moorena sp. SIO2B7]